jgi:hypothetical protein
MTRRGGTSAKPRSLSGRVRNARNLLLVVPAFGLMGGITIGLVWLLQRLQEARCPEGTFLFGSGQFALIFQVIPIMLGSIGVGFLAVNWIAHSIPPVRRFFDRDARQHGERRYRATQRSMLKFSAITLGICLAISVAGSLSQYCLLSDQVLYQRWPWVGMQRYSWHDIRKIETSCTRGKGGWGGSFFLVMRDGSRFDLWTWPRAVVQVYPDIARSLKDVDFVFDSSGVRPGCNVPYLALLTHRP